MFFVTAVPGVTPPLVIVSTPVNRIPPSSRDVALAYYFGCFSISCYECTYMPAGHILVFLCI